MKSRRGAQLKMKSEKSVCFVDSFQCNTIDNNHKANVPADLHELLSTAKSLPELSIRTEGQRS